jgi:formate-dependent nitrite reductase cytochrome c552 subunit
MEKAERFKAKPKLEYSAFEKEMEELLEKRRQTHRSLEVALKDLNEFSGPDDERRVLCEKKEKLSDEFDELTELIIAKNEQETEVTKATKHMLSDPKGTLN